MTPAPTTYGSYVVLNPTPPLPVIVDLIATSTFDVALKILEEERLVEHAAEMGTYLGDRLKGLYDHKSVGDIRVKGLMAGPAMGSACGARTCIFDGFRPLLCVALPPRLPSSTF